ncbi:YecR family lipoprotein [uncultured Thiodictyon sp.]|uniref:YecR family lipoprotein n=1 Tax=uncultured Thiodictyon sp. TaxID=1846217 RepID=UPI00341AE7ED
MAALTACQTTRTPQLTGGSRTEGVVELSYEYAWPDDPAVNFEPGRVAARERCKAWGYLPAELFIGFKSQCLRQNKDDACLRRRVTASYQCTRPSKP